MRNFISEDDIEQAILAKLKAEPFKYDILNALTRLFPKTKLRKLLRL